MGTVRLTMQNLQKFIHEEVAMLTKKQRLSAKTRAGAEEKLLKARLADLEARRARIRGGTPAQAGSRATLDDDIAMIKMKLKGLHEDRDVEGYNVDVGDIVEKLADAFTTQAGLLRGSRGYTYDFQNGEGEHDHRPGDRDRELGTDWDSIVQLAVTDLVDQVTPIVEEIWQKLDDGEYGA